LTLLLGVVFVYGFTLKNLDDPKSGELEVFKSFLQFVQTHQKKYLESEFELRYNNFKENLVKIKQLNEKSPNKVFGVNKFADMSQEEFRSKYLMKKGVIKKNTNIKPEDVLQPRPNIDLPATWDWRWRGAVTRVKNQGQCGSCWAFSVTENVESVWLIAGHSNNGSLSLSPQQIVDCDSSDDGCDGGDPPTAYQYIIQAGGLESNAAYPYTAQDGTCAFDPSQVVAKISSWKYATQNSNENTLQQNLYSWSPLSICVDASSWQYYQGGVVSPSDCGTQLDHCVQMVGYHQGSNYYIVRNSWGTDWGLNGYILLQMGGDTCGCADEATSAVV